MSGEPHFENTDRVGAENLKKAGYVEYPEFEKDVLAQIEKTGTVKGYFCANCEYYIKKKETLHGGFCKKLQAEDAAWGCCNYWDYEPTDLRKPIEITKEGKIRLVGLIPMK